MLNRVAYYDRPYLREFKPVVLGDCSLWQKMKDALRFGGKR